ncbi:hypothetical protein ABIB54_003083 [Frigoribacterium sp. UYMn621]
MHSRHVSIGIHHARAGAHEFAVGSANPTAPLERR